MILQVVIFTVIFLALSAFMVAISFHVYRYRYPHDNTGVVFITFTVVYILLTVMTFLLFDYTPPTSTTTPTQLKNTLL